MIEVVCGIIVGTLVVSGTICLYFLFFPKGLEKDPSTLESKEFSRRFIGGIGFLISKLLLIGLLAFLYLKRDVYDLKIFAFSFIVAEILLLAGGASWFLVKRHRKEVVNEANVQEK